MLNGISSLTLSSEIITSPEIFEALAGEWDDLLALTAAASIFLSWEWLFSWWSHFAEGKRLLIMVMRHKLSGKLAGIIPLCEDQSVFGGMLPVRRLRFMGSDQVGSDFLDLIIQPGMEEEVVSLFFRYLSEQYGRWDMIELADIDAASPTVKYLRRYAEGGWWCLSVRKSICPYMKLAGTYDDFLKTLKAKQRYDLKKKSIWFAHNQAMAISINGSRQELAGIIDDLFKLHLEGFKHKKYGRDAASGFSGSAVKEFHKDILARFLDQRWLRLYQLKEHGRLIAFLYTFIYRDKLFCYQSGFNTEWQRVSPGTILLGHCIRDAISEGCQEFHYLRGNEEYKSRWTRDSKKTVTVTMLQKGGKGALYAGYIAAKENIKKLRGISFTWG